MAVKILALLILYCTCGLAERIAFVGATVIDPRTRTVKQRQVVIVNDDSIESVSEADGKLAGVRRIDATGKFLIPGLWDSHVHLSKAGENSLALFIALGVTSVRDMGSDPAEVLTWRKQIDSGKIVGPRLKIAGPILESKANVERMKREGTVEPVDGIRLPIATPDDARQAVRRLAAMGVDHIKVRTSPDRQSLLATADEARRAGLPLVGHLSGGRTEALDSGLRTIEHGIAFPPLSLDPSFDRRALFRGMGERNIWMSTTTANLDAFVLLPYEKAKLLFDNAGGELDPHRRYVGGYLVRDWKEQVDEKRDANYGISAEQVSALYRDFSDMREEGVQFVAGTDVGVAFVYPGFSLHDELKSLVRNVGFSPMDALRIATHNPAEFYEMTTSIGGIAAGQKADLVMLDADPLADIANTSRIAGVMSRGRWFDRDGLKRMLDAVERRADAAK